MLLVAFCLILSFSPSNELVNDPVRDLDSLSRQLDEELPELLKKCLVPGAAIAVISKGEIVFVRPYGFADLASQSKVTLETGFNIGSISKTVAAWGLMKLVEQGKLNLDKPISNYLKRWQIPESEFDETGITLRRLLSHTAGLSLHGYPGFGPTDNLPTLEASLNGVTNGSGEVRLMMEPGSKWQYSGGGYTIAQLLVEEVSNMSFSDFMREQILKPLAMNHSDYQLSAPILAASSVAYDEFGEVTANPRFSAQAAAGLHTTITDLATFALAVVEGPKNLKPGRGVLSLESTKEMTTPAAASEGRYGLGYGIHKLADGQTAVGHGGSNRGWQANFKVTLELGDGLVIVTNGSNGGAVIGQIQCIWESWLSGTQPNDGCKLPITMQVVSSLLKDGVEAAIRQYRNIRDQDGGRDSMDEGQLNRLGYQLMGRGRIEDATEIFKLNVESFPEASNPYDSLGEAYMNQGNKALAIVNYSKSLELDPSNHHAAQTIIRLKAEESSKD